MARRSGIDLCWSCFPMQRITAEVSSRSQSRRDRDRDRDRDPDARGRVEDQRTNSPRYTRCTAWGSLSRGSDPGASQKAICRDEPICRAFTLIFNLHYHIQIPQEATLKQGYKSISRKTCPIRRTRTSRARTNNGWKAESMLVIYMNIYTHTYARVSRMLNWQRLKGG